MRKYCPFSRQQHVSTRWVSLLMNHHVRRHKPRIRARPALLAGHRDFLWDLAQDILSFLWLIKTMSHIREWWISAMCTRTLTCTLMAHAGYVTLTSNQLHTTVAPVPPVWYLAQDEPTCMCQANTRHKNQVPQTCLFCCLVLLFFPGFFLLLIY